MIKDLRDYIDDKKFRLTLTDGKLHLVNYDKVVTIDSTYVSLLLEKKVIMIKGEKLTVLKLLEKELLLSGIISSITFA